MAIHAWTDHRTDPRGPRTPRSRRDPAAPVPSPPGNSDATASIGDPVATVPPADERPDPSDSSTGELLRTLTENVQTLVRGEVASARQEMTEKALAARPAAAMLGGAAVLGALAAGTSAVVLVRVLDRFLPPAASAAVATALLGGGAAALAGPEPRSCASSVRPSRSARSRT